MHNRLLTRSYGSAARRLSDWRRSLGALWRAFVGACRHALARRHALDIDIDGTTLRDLGISRSELSSFRAEAEGRAERTRLRVFDLHVGGS